MSGAARRPKNERAAVRVVIITTHYIETDPAGFKSVVQRLTGKHAHRYFHTNRNLPYRKPPPQRPPPSQSKVDPGGCGKVIGCSTSSGNNYMNSSSFPIVQSRGGGVSFSDLDRLLIMDQLPSWNELSQLCID